MEEEQDPLVEHNRPHESPPCSFWEKLRFAAVIAYSFSMVMSLMAFLVDNENTCQDADAFMSLAVWLVIWPLTEMYASIIFFFIGGLLFWGLKCQCPRFLPSCFENETSDRILNFFTLVLFPPFKIMWATVGILLLVQNHRACITKPTFLGITSVFALFGSGGVGFGVVFKVLWDRVTDVYHWQRRQRLGI